MRIFNPNRLHFIELYEEDRLEILHDKLASFGFRP